MTLPEILAKLDELRAAVVALMDLPPVTVPPTNEAPFGRTLDGKPRFSPAYDACRGMWEAAQRAGTFSIFALIGGGLKPLAGQMTEDFQPDLLAIEQAILALGRSPWGQEWLSHDENAALIDRAYCRLFVGYHVERVNQNDQSQGFRRVP